VRIRWKGGQGFYLRLLALEEPKYSIEQICFPHGQKCYVIAARLTTYRAYTFDRRSALYREEIRASRHRAATGEVQPAQQEQALPNCSAKIGLQR